MKVLTFLPRYDLQRRIEKALSSAQFVVDRVFSAEECSQFTRSSRYDGVLVDSDCLPFAETLLLVKQLRKENSHASLFAFARFWISSNPGVCLTLVQMTAGVASEVAVRLGLSIRLRQVAFDLGPRIM